MANREISGTVPSGRMVWIDGFRGLAVVIMVWVHVANTLLTTAEQAKGWYVEWTFFHGLVAPAFFWIGGYVRGVRVSKLDGKRPGWKAVKRLLGVMLLGYAMHFPWGALIDWDWNEAAWLSMMKVDVLQTLAFAGLLMVAVERFVPAGSMQPWVMGGLAVAFVMMERWAGDWSTGRGFLDAWLNRQTGSVFCLFPWVGFGLAGWLCGRWSVERSEGAIWLFGCAGAALAWGVPQMDWVGQGEAFFLQRLGWVILVALAVAGVFRFRAGRGERVLRGLLLAGRESLVMYVTHLTLIHAVPLPSSSLEQGFGKTQTVAQVVGWFVLVAGMSWGVAWWNERRKLGPSVG